MPMVLAARFNRAKRPRGRPVLSGIIHNRRSAVTLAFRKSSRAGLYGRLGVTV
jgi:hypothetical protein